MNQYETIRVVQGTAADKLLATNTPYSIRNIRFDGTVSYGYENAPQSFGIVEPCEDCGRITYTGEWEGMTMLGTAKIRTCDECARIREIES